MMSKQTPKEIYLQDYRPPDFLVSRVELRFELAEGESLVSARLLCRRNPEAAGGADLVLDGRCLELVALSLDGRPLAPADYRLDDEQLVIKAPPDHFTIEQTTRIYPQRNTALEGLYRSNDTFCTQCEAQGFRKIIYFPDRPDVMARYEVTIVADRARYPVLLANGNLEESGVLEGGRHFARWSDPFPKPCYLFALVAGDLAEISDSFTTLSGRQVSLHIYVEHHNRDKCGHAMASLKKAMRWDEEVFGLEYDLDRYMIVAVDDFNMGAMENKGLNLFNSKYVLARPDTATDDDFEGIESVIAHEYFHNWTGNRVTCRDWFQLSLKEGLTVFRDQEFSSEMASRAVKRIHDVRMLRNRQFPEDSGPMAHPVRPASYLEINNFYTLTVYEKGSELIRMLQVLLGEDGFRRGLALYLSRHDGQAVTTDDFVAAMEEAGGIDLAQFRRWYSQAGTPLLAVRGRYDARNRSYVLTIRQSCPPTPGQPDKEPLHIPVKIGLYDGEGAELPLQLDGQPPSETGSLVLQLQKDEERFCLVNVPTPPIPSLMRGFSAPVKFDYPYTQRELEVLLTHDADPFSRWEAGQQLACRVMLPMIGDWHAGGSVVPDRRLSDSFGRILLERELVDGSFKALLLTLPSEEYLGEQLARIDVDAIHGVHEGVMTGLAGELAQLFLEFYEANCDPGPYRFEPRAVGRRRLKNLCLSYLIRLATPAVRDLCLKQFEESDNMTDCLAALRTLAHSDLPERRTVLDAFQRRWRDEVLVIDKWFAIQATAPQPSTLEAVQGLMAHPAFSLTNPNRVRALIGAFCTGNPVCFHASDGSGYLFLADQVLALDRLNPQIAARLLQAMSRWRRYGDARQQLMRQQLERIAGSAKLSRDVYEVAVKSLR